MVQRLSSGAGAIWNYVNTDAIATVQGAGYITNGAQLGMEKGDVVLYIKTDTPTASWLVVTSVTVGGSASLGATAVTAS